MAVRVLIVDDHRIVRQGLRLLLGQDRDIEVVGEAANGQEGVMQAQSLKPDVILMDLMMPVMNGIEAIAQIRKELPDTEVLALTSVLEEVSVAKAVQAGAIGYILKDTESQELNQAIKAAAAGQIQLSTRAIASLMQRMREPEPPTAKELSKRELEVITLLAQGQSNKEIAHTLNVSETTVKSHVSNLLAKLGVQSRTQAAYQATRLGLINISQEPET